MPTQSRLAVAGGCGSSGTTLLAHLVSRHETIASGPEFNCFNHLEIYDMAELRPALPALLAGKAMPSGYIDVPVFMTFRDQYGISTDLIKSWVDQSKDTNDFASSVTDHLLHRFESHFFFEKSPTNVYGMAIGVDRMPDVRFVHLIRDGRDVVPSLMKRGWNLFGAASRWLYDTVKGLEARGRENYLELRYEELVRHPIPTLTRVLAHLGVDGSAEDLIRPSEGEKGVYSEDWKARSEPRAWTQTPADPISTKSIGRYKTALSKRDLSVLNRVYLARNVITPPGLPRSFHELLEFLNYEETSSQLPIPSITRISYQTSDYLRRVRRFWNRNYWSLPRLYTVLR